MYQNLGDYAMVKNLYLKIREQQLEPNLALLNCALESSIRTDDVEIVISALNDFLRIKREPHQRLLHRLNNMKHMPDRLYVLLKENFNWSGQMSQRTR